MIRRSQVVSFAALLSIVLGSLTPFVPRVAAQQQPQQPAATEAPTAAQEGAEIKDSAREEIDSLLREKESRTAAQRKLDSQLLYAIKEKRGQRVSDKVANVPTAVEIKESGLTLVDIGGRVTPALLARIKRLGGEVVYSSESENTVRALVPYDRIEALARSSAVRFIEPAVEAATHRSRGRMIPNVNTGDALPADAAPPTPSKTLPNTVAPKPQARLGGGKALSPDFAARIARVKEQLEKSGMLAAATTAAAVQQQTPNITGAIVSEGDETHQARIARNIFSATGSGVKIGVLSDGVDSLAALQQAGELPSDVTVLPGQAGAGSEGTAMLEIIHDLAPGAQLYFATAFISAASFANNIRALRAAGCDIIVDDIIYFDESPFQDGPIARAVNDVTADGALYFSSAGNDGNVTDNTAGHWEGDFADAGPTSGFTTPAGTPVISAPGQLHDFNPGPGVAIQNPVVRASTTQIPATLFWADPLGASTNDYDLFLINETGTGVVTSSTNVQNGTQNPYERLNIPVSPAPSGRRIVIVKKPSAAPRYLYIGMFGALFAPAVNANIPAFNTPGQTRGHSAAAAAFSVAATPAGPVTFGPNGPLGPFPNFFNPSNVSETFTSDGPRRVFFNPDGSPITPGDFSSTGGAVRQKPDITAADGVSTATPGFEVFFGTSASAPHAAAIAGLMLSGNSALEPDQVRAILTATNIDIETPGVDRDTGAGIVMSFVALAAIGAQPSPALLSRTGAAPVVAPIGGGDQFIEPGESGSLSLSLLNRGGRPATNVQATLTTTTPGVTITQGSATFPDIAKFTTAANNTPFEFALAEDAECGARVDFNLTVTYDGGVVTATGENLSPLSVSFSTLTGAPGTTPVTTTYGGPPVPIPDNSPAGPAAVVPLTVSGFTGNLSDINFRFGGSACTAAAGATTVGLDHTYVGDLAGFLVSPRGTIVQLFNQPGDDPLTGPSSGNNFCNTVLDDSAPNSIQTIVSAGAPYTGTFAPANPLSAFNGENPNGTWRLFVFDTALIDTGSVREFSLDITPYECDGGGTPATSQTRTFKSGVLSGKAANSDALSPAAADELRRPRPSISLRRRAGVDKEAGQGDQAP